MSAVRTAAAKASRAPVDPARRSALAKIHVAKKELGLDDDTYRAIIGRAAKGKNSAGDLSTVQLGRLIDELKRLGFKAPAPKRAGRRKLADGEQHRKIRALWLTLWNLGVVRSSSEDALAAFVKRQTRKDALQWCMPHELNRVVEALKDWAVRDGGVDWQDAHAIDDEHCGPRRCVVLAQWQRLLQLGVIEQPEHVTAESYGYRCGLPAGFQFYTPADWDRLIGILGRMIREEKGRKR